MKHPSQRRTPLAALLLLALLAPPALAQQQPAIIRESDTATVDEKGDATFSGKMALPNEEMYSRIKENFPNPYILLRNMLGKNGKAELKDATASYDDGKRQIQYTATVLGAATCRRNKWRLEVGKSAELLYADGHTCIVVNALNLGGVTALASGRVELPAGAKNFKIDSETGHLVYDLPREPKKGDVSVEAAVKVKPHLITAAYKVYGNAEFSQGSYWTAKSLLTNSGTGDITHLKISYRLGDYTQWSPPTEYSLVPPGGHVVDLYYPLLSKEVAALQSKTPVDLEVKWTYTDAAGKEYSDTDSKRTNLLGVNGFVFSNVDDQERTNSWGDMFGNAPLLAAFVTKMDDPVRAFQGLVSQASGGPATGITDKDTIRFCQALYEMEVANNFAYQGSTELQEANSAVAQAIKFPRDVLRDKAGTCVELAILYAAVCESAGIKANLVLHPGHCYTVIKLPESGQYLPVECTGVNEKSASFKDATTFAYKNWSKDNQPGAPASLIAIDSTQGDGINTPELPKLPADIVNQWGLKIPQAPPAPQPQPRPNPNERTGGGDGPGPNPGPAPEPPRADAAHPAALVGVWRLNMQLRNGLLISWTWSLNANGTYQTVLISAQGTAKDEGNWKVDGRQLLNDSLTHGQVFNHPFAVQRDVLDMQDPTLGNIRFRRVQ